MAQGLARKGFDIDLADGIAAENELVELLSLSNGKIEVKKDEQAHKTGNLFIELYGRDGKVPSGFSTTESDWWVFVVNRGTKIIVSREELRRHVERALYENGLVKGGDKNKTRGVLIRLRWLMME